MLGGTKGRSMQKLESLGGAGILDAAEGGRGRLEAKFGGDRRGPGGGGVASGVGDAVGVEGGGQGSIEDRKALSIGGGETEPEAAQVIISWRAVVGVGVRVGGIDGGDAVIEARLPTQMVMRGLGGAIVKGTGDSGVGRNIGIVERRGESAGGGVVVGRGRRCGGVAGSTDEIDGARADGDAILAVVDAATVGEDVDICAFRTEFAIALGRERGSVKASRTGRG